MLRYPELVMNTNKQIANVFNGKKVMWSDREESKEYFLEMMMSADGEEHEQAEYIYI